MDHSGSASSDALTDISISQFEVLYGQALRASDLPGSETGEVLNNLGARSALAADLAAMTRKYAEARVGMFVRHTTVNSDQSLQQLLDATGKKQLVDSDAAATMPRGQDGNVEMRFFQVDRDLDDLELQEEYRIRGMVPYPWAQIRVNIDDPAFAVKYTNTCHWQDEQGIWHFLKFESLPDGGGVVIIESNLVNWPETRYESGSWFGGVTINQHS